MKNYYRVIGFLAVFFLLGIGFIYYITREGAVSDLDKDVVSLDLNDIVKRASDNWESLDTFDNMKYSFDYIILDNNNKVMYDSRHQETLNSMSNKLNVTEAINSRRTYAYVLKDGQVIGSVIRSDEGNEQYRELRIRLLLASVIFCIVFLAGAFSYGHYINKNIIVH